MNRKSFGLVLTAALTAFAGSPAAGQSAVAQGDFDDLYRSIYFAWDRGDYVSALEQAESALTSPAGDALTRPLALLTGELYPVSEIAPDGSSLRWSHDGRYVSYEIGSEGAATIHVVRVDGDRPLEVASFAGWNATFLADGRLAYFRLPGYAELDEARRAEEAAAAAGDDERQRFIRAQISVLQAQRRQIVVRSIEDGQETILPAEGLERYGLATAGDGSVILVGRRNGENDRYDLFLLREGAEPRRLSRGPGVKGTRILAAGAEWVVYTIGSDRVAVQRLDGGGARTFVGRDPVVSRDGSRVAFLSATPSRQPARSGAIAGAELLTDGSINRLMVLDLRTGREPRPVKETTLPLASPALSPSGDLVAFTMVLRDDWEIFTLDLGTGEERRVTQEVQHDIFPAFLAEDRLLAVMGEARHRRAYLHPLEDAEPIVSGLPGEATRDRVRLFHNNSVRTVAPQYEWLPSPDGARILVVADRDGDTLSPERGIYLVDLTREVTREAVLARVREQLAGERRLREWGRTAFAPVEAEVRAATESVEVGRIYDHAHALYQFGSKHITQPGNARAIEYLAGALRAMGYEPELEWFEPRPGIRTANVIATLPGTRNPERVHVISSHFDSVERSPGADDNSSGTTALLEAARVLQGRPQAETIRFAFLTGEEAGLLGGREHVRRALDNGDQIVSVLNNDMVGWSGGHRLDDTIRYSNDTIRDIQHNAAILFSDLITYDARYVRSTDAQAFWDAYGNIVGGIGSYPILGNPHYHQAHDTLEVVNQQLVAEVAKTTVAAVMLLASGEVAF